uniref:Uncharacterized protein n=1 Tax=Paramormyrops kingsleyae TaxID=1676925 RepID=A0A3B3QNI5_9TELE
IIQSSQPSSLKFTCSGLRLHRVFRLPAPRPPPPPMLPGLPERAVLLRRRRLWLRASCAPTLDRRPPRAFILSRISRNRFSFLRLREKVTSSALSWGCRHLRLRPSATGCTAASVASEMTAMSRHRGEPLPRGSGRTAAHTSNASHLADPVSSRSTVRESRRRLVAPPSGQVASGRLGGGLRRIRSSAPTSSSALERLEMSNRYRWPGSVEGWSVGRDGKVSGGGCHGNHQKQ